MLINKIKDRVIAASKADPVTELALQLCNEGVTEAELVVILKDKCFSNINQSFKINLQNKLREFNNG